MYIGLFIAGFVATALFFYIFLPSMFSTSVCCGQGTELVHGIISASLGLVGGFFATFILQIGLFFTGCCFGFLCSMLVMATPLGETAMLNSAASFILVYIGSSLAGGFLALFFQQIFIIITTSLGGSFGFFLALDTFLQTNFNVLASAILDRFKQTVHLSPGGGVQLENVDIGVGGYLMFFFWMLMALAGILFQYRFLGFSGSVGDHNGAAATVGQKEVVVVMEKSRRKKRTSPPQPPQGLEEKQASTNTGGGFFGFNVFGRGGDTGKEYKSVRMEAGSESDFSDAEDEGGNGTSSSPFFPPPKKSKSKRFNYLSVAMRLERYRSQSAKYKTKASKYKVEFKKLQDKLKVDHDKRIEEEKRRVLEEERLVEMQQRVRVASSSFLSFSNF